MRKGLFLGLLLGASCLSMTMRGQGNQVKFSSLPVMNTADSGSKFVGIENVGGTYYNFLFNFDGVMHARDSTLTALADSQAAHGGGSGGAAGSTGDVQFNRGGVLEGASDFYYNTGPNEFGVGFGGYDYLGVYQVTGYYWLGDLYGVANHTVIYANDGARSLNLVSKGRVNVSAADTALTVSSNILLEDTNVVGVQGEFEVGSGLLTSSPEVYLGIWNDVRYTFGSQNLANALIINDVVSADTLQAHNVVVNVDTFRVDASGVNFSGLSAGTAMFDGAGNLYTSQSGMVVAHKDTVNITGVGDTLINFVSSTVAAHYTVGGGVYISAAPGSGYFGLELVYTDENAHNITNYLFFNNAVGNSVDFQLASVGQYSMLEQGFSTKHGSRVYVIIWGSMGGSPNFSPTSFLRFDY